MLGPFVPVALIAVPCSWNWLVGPLTCGKHTKNLLIDSLYHFKKKIDARMEIFSGNRGCYFKTQPFPKPYWNNVTFLRIKDALTPFFHVFHVSSRAFPPLPPRFRINKTCYTKVAGCNSREQQMISTIQGYWYCPKQKQWIPSKSLN